MFPVMASNAQGKIPAHIICGFVQKVDQMMAELKQIIQVDAKFQQTGSGFNGK
jgi:hypothetical protein